MKSHVRFLMPLYREQRAAVTEMMDDSDGKVAWFDALLSDSQIDRLLTWLEFKNIEDVEVIDIAWEM